jgi:hypothetical protein
MSSCVTTPQNRKGRNLRHHLFACGALAAAIPAGAAAQDLPATISATDPDGMARAMEFAGYPVEVGTDDWGDPKIETEFQSWIGRVLFYGCDEDTGENCDSVQFSAGFDTDREISWNRAHELFGNERFIAMSKDGEGDLFVQWDIYTGKGIPTPVFMRALQLFSEQVSYVGSRIFEEDDVEDGLTV